MDLVDRAKMRQWLERQAAPAQRYRRQSALERIYLPNKPRHGIPAGRKRAELYDFVAQTITPGPILYLEFGVFSGKSMAEMIKRFTHPDCRFIGFDSFEGLPERWGVKGVGNFNRDGQLPDIADPRVSFVKGWFQNTVPGFLDSLQVAVGRAVLVHFDADLYSSTLFLLSSLWPRLPEYYFIFDEFFPDELVAMDDFVQAYPVDYEFFSQTNAEKIPVQIFGYMKRKPLVVTPAPPPA